MSSTADQVLAETRRFWAALPQLRTSLEGRWVVFYQGQVVSDHATEPQALQAAAVTPGASAPFVVALVAEEKPTPLSAASFYAIELHA